MSKFIYNGTLNEKYVAGTILSDNVEANKVSVNTIDSTRDDINILKNVSITGDLDVSGDINIEDFETNELIVKQDTNNKLKISNNTIQITKNNGTNWYNLIKTGSGQDALIVGAKENTASGNQSYAEGYNTTASGNQSHAEGGNTTAAGIASHVEGFKNGDDYLIYGTNNYYKGSRGSYSHCEGGNCSAIGEASHAEGGATLSIGNRSHTEGRGTITTQEDAHAEGRETIASGNQAHAEGSKTTASGQTSHAEGYQTVASANQSHAGGLGTISNTLGGYAIGKYNISGTNKLLVVGNGTADNDRKDAFVVYDDGTITALNGNNGIKLDPSNTSIKLTTDGGTNWGNYPGVGQFVYISGVLRGEKFNDTLNNQATGTYSHAEGSSTTASGEYSHAEGQGCISQGISAHSEGRYCSAINHDTHAEGRGTTASNFRAHAEGYNTTASGSNSHSGGEGTIASQSNQTVIGQYNIDETGQTTNKLFVVGNGNDGNNRSDAFVVYKNGNLSLNNSLITIGKGSSQFLTFAEEDYAQNDNNTRSISNDDFSYSIMGDIVNIIIPLRSNYKFVSSYRSRNDLVNDFVDDYLLNIDLSGIKSSLDTFYNATTSSFNFTFKQDVYISNNQINNSSYLLTISNNSNYSNQYPLGIVLIINSKGPASGSKTGDYGNYYIEDFTGFSQNQCLNLSFKYVKLT